MDVLLSLSTRDPSSTGTPGSALVQVVIEESA
jgi:hypothetical protein